MTWTLDVPERLRLAIADAVILYARLESLCIECVWEIENADIDRKREIAKNWGEQNFKLVRNAVRALPGGTDASTKIWPTLKWLGKERNIMAHSVWLWTSEGRPLYVWHSKLLETDEEVGAEFYDWSRFELFDMRVKALVNTFDQFKRLLVQANMDAAANGIEIPKTPAQGRRWRADRRHWIALAAGCFVAGVVAGLVIRH